MSKHQPINQTNLIAALLEPPIAFHRIFVDITGSLTAALLLSQIWYWHRNPTTQARPGQWFYKTRDEWKRETGLSRFELESARKRLREKGLLEESLKGAPAKLHFRLNEKELFSQTSQLAEN